MSPAKSSSARGDSSNMPPPSRKKRGPVFWTVIVLICAAGGAWLVNFVHRAIVFEETDDAFISGHIHVVSPRMDGIVTEVMVDENQEVKAGQVLLRLDPLAVQIALQKSKAALEAARAEALQAQTAVDRTQAEDAQAQAQVAVAAAQLRQSEARLQLANVNRGRDERLFQADTRTVSKAAVDITRNTAEASAADVAAAEASLTAAKANARVSVAAIESARAHVASSEAKVEAEKQAVRDAERKYAYTSISSPEEGRIGAKNVEVGNRLQVGQAVFALVGRECWVTANFKETQLKDMHAGQRAEITVDAIGGRQFEGRVVSIAPATGAVFALLPADNATGNFTKVVQRVPVKIALDSASVAGFEDRLRPGLSTVVSVRIK